MVSGSVTPTERQAAKLLVEAGIGELGRGGREGLGTIYVGPSLASMTLVGNRGSGGRVDWGSLGADGVVVWKADNSDIVLAGGRPRGTAHAVVMFLEEQGGWRWWPDGTRGCSMIRAWIRSGVNHCS